ncbi:hypothetical protein [Rhizobacter sp. LjRoot28]|jgi:PBP1b-binding outer membrane lipoprotein LpoB|uniref:hypothetical protein n=1 Tax=Rhizobacter sp. LjRoot28 TaxID=3342309 RepID=UPI003ECE942D
MMKLLPTSACATLLLALGGCVSVQMPAAIAEAQKAAEQARESKEAKDLIQAARGATGTGRDKPVINHSYIGRDDQTVADIKQSCVVEATQKFAQMVGTDVRSVVLENEVVTARGKVVANCRLALQE